MLPESAAQLLYGPVLVYQGFLEYAENSQIHPEKFKLAYSINIMNWLLLFVRGCEGVMRTGGGAAYSQGLFISNL